MTFKRKGNAKDVPKLRKMNQHRYLQSITSHDKRWLFLTISSNKFNNTEVQKEQKGHFRECQRIFENTCKNMHLIKQLDERRVSSWRRGMAGTSSHQTAASQKHGVGGTGPLKLHTQDLWVEISARVVVKKWQLSTDTSAHILVLGEEGSMFDQNRPAARMICLLRGCVHLFQVIDRLSTQLESRALCLF